MCICSRQTFCLPTKLFISSRSCSLKFFSAFSPANHNFSSNYGRNNLLIKKISAPKRTQYKKFSLLQNIQSYYDFVRTSEASLLTKQFLIDAHEFMGLPWFVTLITASSVLKLFVSLPAGIFQQRLVAALELTKLELDERVPKLKKEVLERGLKQKWTKSKFQSAFRSEIRQEWKSLVVKNNCHPFKATILFFIQFPFWLILTVTIRALANDVYTNRLDDVMTSLQFTLGGPFWCKNLALSDPTYILPTINFIALIANAEISFASKAKVPPSISGFIINKILPNFIRLLAVAFFFISSTSPSGLSLFWASSSVLALGQNLLFMSPRVKRFLRIPKVPSESETPYRKTWNSIVEKWTKLFSRKN